MSNGWERGMLSLLTLALACSSSGSAAGPEEQPLSVQPPALFASGLAFDRDRGVLVVVGGQDDAGVNHASHYEWNGALWTRGSGSAPGARFWSALSYDDARHRVVFFGGTAGSAMLGDTWEYDGTRWTALQAPGPAGRYAHEMAHDTRRNETLMFGGTDGQVLNDLWSWNGTRWQQLGQQNAPPARAAFGMAFDTARGELVVFGGFAAGGGQPFVQREDTWVWDGTNWTQRVTANGPGARDHAAMAYDAARRRVVLFGGVRAVNGTPSSLTDTWEWDGNAWTRRATAGPDTRGGHRIVYDARIQRVVLWTGDPGGANPTAIWSWDGSSWQKLP